MENFKERYCLEYLGKRGRIILKLPLNKYDGCVWYGPNSSGWGEEQVEVSYKYSNEPSGSINCEVFLTFLTSQEGLFHEFRCRNLEG